MKKLIRIFKINESKWSWVLYEGGVCPFSFVSLLTEEEARLIVLNKNYPH